MSARSVRGSVERARAHLRRIISKGFDRCVHVRPFLHTLPLVYCALRHFRPRRQRRRGSAVIDIPGRYARSFGAAVQSMMMPISGRRKRPLALPLQPGLDLPPLRADAQSYSSPEL